MVEKDNFSSDAKHKGHARIFYRVELAEEGHGSPMPLKAVIAGAVATVLLMLPSSAE